MLLLIWFSTTFFEIGESIYMCQYNIHIKKVTNWQNIMTLYKQLNYQIVL